MVVDVALLFLGLALLYFGAEYLVKGSANTAAILGVDPIVVGLTVVALGTSMPEFLVCMLAALKGSGDIALGTVLGSNIANIGLVMAAGAIVYPMVIRRRAMTLDLPVMIVMTLVWVALSVDGEVSRVDGAILLSGIIIFTVYMVWSAVRGKNKSDDVEEEVSELLDKTGSLRFELAITAGGIAGVVIGAKFLIDSASSIATSLGVSQLVIGVSIVAVGTSLPELATTAIAAMRRQSDIAVGAIIGSNIYNIGWVFGATAIAQPLKVEWSVLTHEMVIMTLFALAMIPSVIRLRMGRVTGILLLSGYVVFIGWMVIVRGAP